MSRLRRRLHFVEPKPITLTRPGLYEITWSMLSAPKPWELPDPNPFPRFRLWRRRARHT